METPSRHSFALDGATRVFPVASPIKGDNYCRLEVDGVIINDRAKYDIVNNSIVFLTTELVPNGSQLDILVVQSEEAIGQLAITTNIDIVAQDIDNINIVGDDIANVNTVATNIADVTSVADNMAEVLLADTNAATATTQAGIATTQAGIATTQAGIATTQATDASASAAEAQASLDEFQGQYRGALSTPPTVGVDVGDLYFDTSLSSMRVYNGIDWKAAGFNNVSRYTYTTVTDETVITVPFNTFSTQEVFINGVHQLPGTAYTVSGSVFTFSEVVRAGSDVYFLLDSSLEFADYSSIDMEYFTAEEGQQEFVLVNNSLVATEVMVFLNGVKQKLSAYSFNGNLLTFSETLSEDDEVEVMAFAKVVEGETPKFVPNISTLLTTSIDLVQAVNVLNYHSDVEGGGGVFYWDATKAKSEHNGGTIIDPTAVYPTDWNNQTQLATWLDTANVGTGCWVRQDDGAVNVKWFGAKGDGVTDDSASCQAAWDANDPKAVYVPVGNLLVNSAVTGKFYSVGSVTVSGTGSITITNLAGLHNSPDNFSGTDAQKLQAAINYSIANGYQSISIDRLYDITGSTLIIDKGVKHTEGANNFARKRITFIGVGVGEIRKKDTGFIFSATSGRNGDIAFDNITFSGNAEVAFPTIVSGLSCFDCDKLIRIATTNCTFRNLDYVWYQDGTVASPMQSVKSVNDTYTKNNVILHFNQAWDVVFDGGLMEDGVQFISCFDVNSTIRNLIVNNGCTIEGMTGTAIELNCVNYGTKITNSYFEANLQHIQMNRYNYGVSISSNSFYGRGNVPAGNSIRCIDVSVGDFPIIVDGNISTETTANTTLIYIDETSVYNVDGRNLIGNNDVIAPTVLVNVPDRYVDMVSLGSGFQNRWSQYTPTLSWTGATPAGVSTSAWYKQIGTTVFIKVKISATNGNNATNMTMTLPFNPKFTNRNIYVPAYQAIGAGVSARFVYVRDDNVNNDITWLYMGTATAGQTFETRFELSYEIE